MSGVYKLVTPAKNSLEEFKTLEQEKKGSVSLKTIEMIQFEDQGENGMKENKQHLADLRPRRRREGSERKCI